MEAYYYCIKEYCSLTCIEGGIVMEGILRDSEDRIFPRQETGIRDLPYECECHKFHQSGYIMEGYYFRIERDQLLPFKI